MPFNQLTIDKMLQVLIFGPPSDDSHFRIGQMSQRIQPITVRITRVDEDAKHLPKQRMVDESNKICENAMTNESLGELFLS